MLVSLIIITISNIYILLPILLNINIFETSLVRGQIDVLLRTIVNYNRILVAKSLVCMEPHCIFPKALEYSLIVSKTILTSI